MNAYEQYGQVTKKRADAQKANMGSTYDEVPQVITSGLGSPLTFGPPDDDDKDDRTFDQKIYDGLKSFGAMFFGDTKPDREQTILDAYDNDPMLSVPDVSEKGVLDHDLLNARIADAVDYSKAPPIAYESGIPNDANMRYDEVPPPSANKNLAANSIKTAVKQTFPDSKFYKIKRGDTLGEIALENGVTVDDLVKVNALEDKTGDTIIAGNTLVIPESKDMERVKQYVLAADPERQFYQSGVPMDQRIFEPELGADAQSVTGYDDVPQMVRGLMSKTNIVKEDFDTSDVESDRVSYESVKKVQKRLNDLGYTTLMGDLKVDGQLGAGTARQLRKFQAEAGLPVTAAAGQPVDEATQRALKNNTFYNKEGKDSKATVTPLQDGLFEIIKAPIAKIESGGEAEPYAAIGGFNDAYDGKYQLGKAAKDTIKNRRVEDADGNMVDVFTAAEKVKLNHPSNRADFRNDKELQEKAFRQLTEFNHGELTKNSAKYRAMDQANQLAVLGYAHNQGAEAALEWLSTKVVGTDAFGTGGDEYSEAITEIFTKDDMLG